MSVCLGSLPLKKHMYVFFQIKEKRRSKRLQVSGFPNCLANDFYITISLDFSHNFTLLQHSQISMTRNPELCIRDYQIEHEPF